MEFKVFGLTCRLEIVIISLLVGFVLGGHLLCSCSKIGLVEGLTMINGASVDYKMSDGSPGSWSNKALTYAKDMGYQDSYGKYLQNTGTTVPLEDGQMDFFADNKFEPECCPSSYSSSTGCACLSLEQVEYLNQRGGNRSMAPADY